MFILFIMYIWPTQLPPLGLAGEQFSVSHFGSESFLVLFASYIQLFKISFGFSSVRNKALTVGFWHSENAVSSLTARC